MSEMRALTERRKADRAEMARRLVAEMTRAGAKATIEPVGDWAPREREVSIYVEAPGGATIHVDFDGNSTQPDVFVQTWNTRGAVFLNPDVLGDDVNPYHYGKLNRVCHGFDDLIARLRRDVAHFVDGSGYLDHGDPRVAAMRDRYVERGRSWPPGGGQ